MYDKQFFGNRSKFEEKLVNQKSEIELLRQEVKSLKESVNEYCKTVLSTNEACKKLLDKQNLLADQVKNDSVFVLKSIEKACAEVDNVHEYCDRIRQQQHELSEKLSSKRPVHKHEPINITVQLPPGMPMQVPQKDFKAVIKNRVKDLKLDKQAKELSR
jgi:uncharacterized protein YoxC